MPTTTIPCPRCDRPLQVPETVLGKRVRCPGCGEVTRTHRAEPASPYDAPEAKIGPEARAKATWRFQVRVKRGPAGLARGPIDAEVTPGGLVLHRGKAELGRIKAGTGARYEGENLVLTAIDGGEVLLAVNAMTMFRERLAEGLARFLDGRVGRLDASDYAIPRYLSAFALAPVVLAFAGMAGGAIGGGIGGGLAGALVMANYSIVRRERWPVATRIATCLGLTAVGIVAFLLLFGAIIGGIRGTGKPQP